MYICHSLFLQKFVKLLGESGCVYSVFIVRYLVWGYMGIVLNEHHLMVSSTIIVQSFQNYDCCKQKRTFVGMYMGRYRVVQQDTAVYYIMFSVLAYLF